MSTVNKQQQIQLTEEQALQLLEDNDILNDRILKFQNN